MSHNREATQLMQSHLEAVRAQVKDAESTYNTEGELLEIRSRHTTSDLFGDASGAVHLITKARELTTAYYSAVTAAVYSVDELCRPLLAQDPDPAVIKEVADFLDFCNSEASTLGTNYNASVNGRSYGDIATDRFTASPAALAIATFWRTKYDATPEARAAEEARLKAQREAALAREQKRKDEERKKKDRMQNRQLTASRRDALVKEYDALLHQYDADLQAQMRTLDAAITAQHQQQIAIRQADLSALEAQLANCGLFAFAEKKTLREQILRARQELGAVSASSHYYTLLAPYRAAAKKAYDAYQAALIARINRAYQQNGIFRKGSVHAMSQSELKTNEEAAAIQALILVAGNRARISDIKDVSLRFAEMSHQQFSAKLRRMVMDGTLERSEYNYTAYFTVPADEDLTQLEYEYDFHPEELEKPMPTPQDPAKVFDKVKPL